MKVSDLCIVLRGASKKSGLSAGVFGYRWEKVGAFTALLLVTTLTVACKHDSSPAQIAIQAKNLGVYAQIGNQLTELPYGEEERRGFDGHRKGFRFAEPILIAPPDTSFILNLPDAKISDSKIFKLPDAKTATWHVFESEDVDHVDPRPVKSTIEPLGNGLYRVKPTEEASQSTPFLCLWISMPMGSPDRLYALQIKK